MKGTTKSRGQKDKLDRFYTKPEVASVLVKELLDKYPDLIDAIFIEPSAGDGAFVKALEEDERISNENIIALDIAPASTSLCQTKIFENDFLDGDLAARLEEIGRSDVASIMKEDPSRIVFIGNPPFGEQAKLAVAFVQRSLDNGRWCTFILPPSFRKESTQKKLASKGALVDLIDLDDISYRVGNENIDVPSSFFVFDSEAIFEPLPDYTKELPFVKVNPKQEQPDFAIQRVGGTAGRAKPYSEELSKESHYFFIIGDECPDEIIDLINDCDFPERDWTVGPRSISFKEIAARVHQKLSETNGDK